MKRYLVKFKYTDAYSSGRWSHQQCELSAQSVREAMLKCITWYGLHECEYEIESVTEVIS